MIDEFLTAAKLYLDIVFEIKTTENTLKKMKILLVNVQLI